jgi:hypothetical protein
VDAGAVNIMYGVPFAYGYQIWTQEEVGANTSETSDWFGYALTAGDFGGDGDADLVVGVPLEDVGAIVDAGAIMVLYGQATGLTATGSQTFHQDTTDVVGVAETGDVFGGAMSGGGKSYDGSDSGRERQQMMLAAAALAATDKSDMPVSKPEERSLRRFGIPSMVMESGIAGQPL